MTALPSSEILVLEDFLRGPDTLQTHLLGWRVSDLTGALYDAFAADADTIMADFADEAVYLETVLPASSLTTHTFQELFPDAFLSYVAQVITPDDLLPPYIRLMVAFKGSPRPWIVDPAWAWVRWNELALTESDPYDVDVIPTDYHLDEALTVTDAVADLFVVSATADGLIAGLDEASAFVTLGSDAPTVAIAAAVAEFLAILATLDEIATAIDEAQTLKVTVDSGDDLTLDSTDASGKVTAGIASADDLALDSVGALKNELAVSLTRADAPAINSGDAIAAIAAVLRTGDTPSASTSDARTLAGRLYTVNEQVIGVEDAAETLDVMLTEADTAAASADETILLEVTPDDSADELILAGDDVATIDATVAVIDELVVDSDDAAVVDGFLALGDDLTLDSADTSTLEINEAIDSGDDLTFDSEDVASAAATVDSGDDLTFDSDDVSTLDITEE